jgi:hypothetical protein
MAPIPAVVARLRREHRDDTGRICPSPELTYGNACQFPANFLDGNILDGEIA